MPWFKPNVHDNRETLFSLSFFLIFFPLRCFSHFFPTGINISHAAVALKLANTGSGALHIGETCSTKRETNSGWKRDETVLNFRIRLLIHALSPRRVPSRLTRRK